MISPVNKFINNVIPHPSLDESNDRYQWIAGDNGLVCEVNPQEALSLEKACYLMNKHLKKLKKVTSIGENEKKDLTFLKGLIEERTQEYKSRHTGFLGAIYLRLKGWGNGGHIDVLSSKVIANIDELTNKNTSNLTDFLKQVAPFEEVVQNSSVRMWTWNPKTDVLEDLEGDPEKGVKGITDLPTIFAKMLEQLENVSAIQELPVSDRHALILLKGLIATRIFASADPMSLQDVKNELFNKIDGLLALPNPPLPSDEKLDNMKIQWNYACHELAESEATFVKKVDACLIHLANLHVLSKNEDIKCSKKLQLFFREDDGPRSLKGCIDAFANLKHYAILISDELKAIDSLDDIETKNSKLAALYGGPEFSLYAGQIVECARYLSLLLGLDQSLRDKNSPDLIKDYMGHEGVRPQNDFDAIQQRLPRHTLLTKELQKHLSPDSRGYRNALLCISKTSSYGKYLNRMVLSQSY